MTHSIACSAVKIKWYKQREKKKQKLISCLVPSLFCNNLYILLQQCQPKVSPPEVSVCLMSQCLRVNKFLLYKVTCLLKSLGSKLKICLKSCFLSIQSEVRHELQQVPTSRSAFNHVASSNDPDKSVGLYGRGKLSCLSLSLPPTHHC